MKDVVGGVSISAETERRGLTTTAVNQGQL